MEIVSERYGRRVTFHTCSAAGMDLDGLLHFLEAKEKVRITSGWCIRMVLQLVSIESIEA